MRILPRQGREAGVGSWTCRELDCRVLDGALLPDTPSSLEVLLRWREVPRDAHRALGSARPGSDLKVWLQLSQQFQCQGKEAQ